MLLIINITAPENEENGNSTESEYCVYGKCHFCNEDETVCGDDDNMIEGVILYMVPGNIAKKRSPWQRSYKDNVKAPWEDDLNYCKAIKEKTETTRILDMVDVAIFDFLMQNGDRHHYELREDRVLLLDNGKAFGNPSKDFLDILAPLYQCCLLRKSTWERLQVFSGGTLTDLVDRLSKGDLLYPLITDKHKRAIERRLLVVYAVVEICIDRYGEKILKT
ncbi:FAM20B family protein [Megaselia abdita]